MPSSIVDADEGEGEYVFSYSEDISEAERPPVLPEREYVGDVISFRKTTTNMGKPNLTLIIAIPPEVYPVDYPPDAAPDGFQVRYKSLDLSDTPTGRWNAKKLAGAMGISHTHGFTEADFLHRKVKVKLQHFDGAEGPVAFIQDPPQAT